ncbi:MAG: NTP transferase domain-containing protein [Acidobacteria bacterium]|nr:NTP transferase domain-containing protein [Acidobacteriota bacterium]
MTLPALVLSAGLGTRLDPLTRLVAKPAVPLGDRTLVERVLSWLATQGIQQAVLNLHHKPETITAAVGDGAHLGLTVRYSWEQPLLGSAGGPRHALPLVAADVLLIVNGDTLCDVDVPALVAAHAASSARVTMAVVPNVQPEQYNGIAATPQHEVTGFVPRGERAVGSWHFVGVQVVDAAVFAALPDGVAADTVHGIYRDLVAGSPGTIRVWPAARPFIDVGTPADYLRTALRFGAPTAAGDAAGSVIWPGCTMGRDVVLDECIVAGGVQVPDGFRARRSIVLPAAVCRPDDRVDVRDQLAVFPL